MREQLIKALTTLPEVYRTPVVLRDIQGTVDGRSERGPSRQAADAQVPAAPRPADSSGSPFAVRGRRRAAYARSRQLIAERVVEPCLLLTRERGTQHAHDAARPELDGHGEHPRRRTFLNRRQSTNNARREPLVMASAARAAADARTQGPGGQSRGSRRGERRDPVRREHRRDRLAEGTSLLPTPRRPRRAAHRRRATALRPRCHPPRARPARGAQTRALQARFRATAAAARAARLRRARAAGAEPRRRRSKAPRPPSTRPVSRGRDPPRRCVRHLPGQRRR